MPQLAWHTRPRRFLGRRRPPKYACFGHSLPKEGQTSFPGEGLLERIVAGRVAEPGGDLRALTRPLLAQRAEYERRLLECFRNLNVAPRMAALNVLGCIGSEASTPLVLYASLHPSLHQPAIRAMIEIGDAETLARLTPKEADAELQNECWPRCWPGASAVPWPPISI